jgi:membrane protein implicated in regulation of membrane protease activity
MANMGWFLGLGIAGLVLLMLSLVFDGLLEGVFDGLSGGLDGFLSLPVIAGFMSMLGFAGAITLGTTGLGAGAATGVGTVAGVGAGWLTWKLSRALMRDGASVAPRGEDLVGSSGSVVTRIPADGYGEVLLYLGGQPLKFAAKSSTPVARGSEVWVESVLTATSVAVRPVER